MPNTESRSKVAINRREVLICNGGGEISKRLLELARKELPESYYKITAVELGRGVTLELPGEVGPYKCHSEDAAVHAIQTLKDHMRWIRP